MASVYLPPRSRPEMEERVSDLADWMASIGHSVADLVLLGDLNLCPLDTRQDWQHQAIADLCNTFNLSQIVQEPTHCDRLIDHCLLGDNSIFAQYGLGPSLERKKRGLASGHAVIWTQLQHLRAPKPKPVIIDSWKWSDFDINRAFFLLAYTEDGQDRNLVAEMWSRDSVDTAAQFVTDELLRILRLTCPHHQHRFRRFVPWMSRGLSRLIQQKRGAWRQLKRDPGNPGKLSRWKQLCSRVRTEVRLTKESYVASLFNQVTSVKTFWKAVRKVTSSENSELPAALQTADGSYVTGDLEKVEALAEVLSGNYNAGAFKFPHYPDYLDVDVEYLCNTNFVHTFLASLRPDTAMGLDNLPPLFLRELSIPLAPVITALVNRCMLEGDFPRIWKRARITPIPKVAGTQSIMEFRPITILSILSKLAEKWLLVLLEDHLDTSQFQFGFKKQSGTEDAVAFAQFSIEKALSSCNGAKKAAVISLDICKAFDRCPFGLILASLEKRSVPIPVLRLLRSYFVDRVQVVRCGHLMSAEYPVQSGIGQGSLLGPALFNVFIDGVFSLNWNSDLTIIGYADDVLITAPLATNADCANLQSDLDIITDFYKSLGLQLNAKKSCVLLVAISPNVHFNNIFFTIEGGPLPIASSLKYLGITFTQTLSFHLHTELNASKAKRMLGSLFAACRGVDSGHLRYIYLTKVLPVLLYALPVSCPSSRRDWFTLERVHRFACRLLTNDFSSSYLALLLRLNFSSLQHICLKRQLSLCYKYVYKMRNFPAEIVPNADSNVRYGLRRRGHSLQLPIPVLTRLASLPLFIAFKVWNCFDVNPRSVLLQFSDFRLHLRNVNICDLIIDRLRGNGNEKFYFAVDSL